MAAAEPPELASWFADALPGGAPLAIAVSGGGDSTALLHLIARRRGARPLFAVTVDHGLRPDSAAEAAAVGVQAAALNVPHVILAWTGWDGQGNLQDAAREARIRLIGEWAALCGVAHVATGHTLDDQAETVLLRLARGSGVDGLAAIAPRGRRHGLSWLRPLLGVRRETLRDWLRDEGIAWAEDPSNDDTRFDRVRARQALAALEPLGLTARGLADTALRMAEAKAALAAAAQNVAAPHLTQEGGDLLMPAAPLAAAFPETRHRLLAHLLQTVSGNPYRPRYTALRSLADDILRGRGGTLHGCLVTVRQGIVRIAREPAAVADLPEKLPDLIVGALHAVHACADCDAHAEAEPGDTTRHWDLWHVTGPFAPHHRLTALGDDAEGPLPITRPDLPRASLAASPAVRDGATLIAAPLAGLGADFRAHPRFTPESVLAALQPH